ncbi:nitroreductase family protein [Nocardioides sp.]|uniref:nitroreductase family protein n=1 Tax=Nocardioides sp. TaxID=35761 RepID=UPI00260B06A6|nr:nitroreductase family protein [Nocardioides sp.]
MIRINSATGAAVLHEGDGVAGIEDYEPLVDPNASDVVRRALRSRSSLRNFSECPVPRELLASAVSDALFSPSVCNRQATRTRWFHRDDPQFLVCLKHQNGNRGFGDTAQWVGLITYDNRCFLTPGERNQGYIDAGLFTMTLQYSLHAQGVGACCLNWSMNARQDRRLRADVTIPDHETVVMMLAVGYPAPMARATVSPRRSSATVFLNQ